MPQLTGKEEYPPSCEELEMVISKEDTYLFVATGEDEVIGTLTLVFFTVSHRD